MSGWINYLRSFQILLVILLWGSESLHLQAQLQINYSTRYDTIEKQIRLLESSIPGLTQKINISITDVPLNEFLRAVANNSGLNMDIDPSLSVKVSNNFSDVNVSDVLIFLSRQFRIDISVINNIFLLRQLPAIIREPLCYVQYNDTTNRVTVEVEGEILSTFLKKLTLSTGRNVIPAQDVSQIKVNSFILSMPFDDAVDKMAFSNGLVSRKTDDGFVIIEKRPVEKQELQTQRPNSGSQIGSRSDKGSSNAFINVKKFGDDSLTIVAEGAQLIDVIRILAEKCGKSYILFSDSKNEINAQITGNSFDDIITSLIIGSDLTISTINSISIIGARKSSDLMTQKIIQLKYRSVDSLVYALPKDLLDQVQVRPFVELNSVFLSGPQERVSTAESFIKAIDQLVPVISIELLIIDYSTSFTTSTGIEAGLTDQSVATAGTVFPNVNVTLSSQSINDILNRFNGYGWAKIGQVTPRFYASLKLLETQGILKIRSTPILSTLNGHKAEISIGNTEYYLEESVNIIGTQNPQTATTQTYKPVTAELAVTITPQVSGDNQITLEVEVTQSDFTERISNTAPPGKTSRTFKSQIRVKDGEMILLGGLEERRSSKTSNGTPLLSRIPVIKWLFSSRNEVNSNSKLNIFIKPSIIN